MVNHYRNSCVITPTSYFKMVSLGLGIDQIDQLREWLDQRHRLEIFLIGSTFNSYFKFYICFSKCYFYFYRNCGLHDPTSNTDLSHRVKIKFLLIYLPFRRKLIYRNSVKKGFPCQ